VPFVVDASVALNWHLEDEDSDYCTAVLHYLEEDSPRVPSLFLYEFANGLIVAQRRNRIDSAGIARARTLMSRIPFAVDTLGDEGISRIIEVATRFDLTGYDAAYLELAIRDGLPIATEDRAILAAAPAAGVRILQP
jgi:predicted nucleic acid-binding protein